MAAHVFPRRAASVATTVTVIPAGFTPPYALPTVSGTLVNLTVSGGNNANSSPACRPATYTTGDWEYSLMASYGGGCFAPEYSTGGAYVLASTGGHLAPENVNAAIFDFTTGMWGRVDNANGIAASPSVYDPGDTNGDPWYEILGASPSQIPAPVHPYMHPVYIPPSLGGGTKGSFFTGVGPGVTSGGGTLSRSGSHRMDLNSGLWTRASSTFYGLGGGSIDTGSVIDRNAGRIYILPFTTVSFNRLRYLDLADNTFKDSPTFSTPSGIERPSPFIDTQRNLLVTVQKLVPSSYVLRIIDLSNIGSGWHSPPVNGSLPTPHVRWDYYPDDDCFYTYVGSGSVIHKLQPPASSPLTNTWTVTTRTITPTPATQHIQGGTQHTSRFFYVPAINCFAWIPDADGSVQLIKP